MESVRCMSVLLVGRPVFPENQLKIVPDYACMMRFSKLWTRQRYENQLIWRLVQCLSLCNRPCGIAMASGGAWTYLFGDQSPDLSVNSILEYLSIYLKSSRGEMLRIVRPASLRESIFGRIPPLIDGR